MMRYMGSDRKTSPIETIFNSVIACLGKTRLCPKYHQNITNQYLPASSRLSIRTPGGEMFKLKLIQTVILN